jgi:hypothetical protein
MVVNDDNDYDDDYNDDVNSSDRLSTLLYYVIIIGSLNNFPCINCYALVLELFSFISYLYPLTKPCTILLPLKLFKVGEVFRHLLTEGIITPGAIKGCFAGHFVEPSYKILRLDDLRDKDFILFCGTNIASADQNLMPGIVSYHNRRRPVSSGRNVGHRWELEVSCGGSECSRCRLRRRAYPRAVWSETAVDEVNMDVHKVNKLMLNFLAIRLVRSTARLRSLHIKYFLR